MIGLTDSTVGSALALFFLCGSELCDDVSGVDANKKWTADEKKNHKRKIYTCDATHFKTQKSCLYFELADMCRLMLKSFPFKNMLNFNDTPPK